MYRGKNSRPELDPNSRPATARLAPVAGPSPKRREARASIIEFASVSARRSEWWTEWFLCRPPKGGYSYHGEPVRTRCASRYLAHRFK